MVKLLAKVLRDRRTRMVFFFLCFVLLWSRFWALAEKPYHHDEGIYATLSHRFYKNYDYRFSPVTHGPFLFTFQGFLFRLLGPNDFTGRLPVALAGFLLPFIAFPAFGTLGSRRALLWLGLCALSPTLCFFSRFLGMDALMAAFAAGLWVSALAWWRTKRSIYFYASAFALSMMMCTKLNWLFYAFPFASFLLITGDYKPVLQRLRTHWQDTLGGAIVVVYFFGLLYSTLGKNFGGIWDGLYREMIPYWIQQNKMQRIAGPFHYYLTLISIYELPLLIGLTGLLYRHFKDRFGRKVLLTALGFSAALYGALSWQWVWLKGGFNSALHLSEPWHLSLLIFEVCLGFLTIRDHLKRQEKLKAFLAYWMFFSLLIYSYAGEKIPWLTVHILLPAYLYLAASIPFPTHPRVKAWAYASVFVVAFWQGFNMIRACLVNFAHPSERLVYTHTTYELDQFVERADRMRKTNPQLKVYVKSDCEGVWPLAWYLRDYKEWFRHTMNLEHKPEIVVDNWERREDIKANLKDAYSMRFLPLRAWWVPDPYKYSLSNFVRYYFLREQFNPTGTTNLAVFIRRDVQEAWDALP